MYPHGLSDEAICEAETQVQLPFFIAFLALETLAEGVGLGWLGQSLTSATACQ